MLYFKSLGHDDEISCRWNLHNTDLCHIVICVPVSVFRDDNKEDIFVHQVKSVITSLLAQNRRSLTILNLERFMAWICLVVWAVMALAMS